MTSDAVTNCPLCGSLARLLYRGNTDPRIFFNSRKEYAIAGGSGREKLDIYQCTRCGLGFSPHDMTNQELREFYADQPQDDRYLMEEQGRRKTFRKVLHRIGENIFTKGKILDYGSGPAFFLDEAKKDGWDTYGVEAALWAREYAKEHFGITVMTDDDFEKFPDGFFDAITIFDVIEHVASPIDLLRYLSQKLKPGGIMILTTPRFESWSRKLMGRRWGFIFPAHLWYFTQEALSLLVIQVGLESPLFEYHVFHFSLSYLFSRLSEALPFLSTFTKVFIGKYFQTIQIPFSTGEEWEVFAKKSIQ